MKRQTRTTSTLTVLVALLAGCATAPPRDGWTGPARPSTVSVERWAARDEPAAILKSPRYRVYTTVPPGARRDALPQVLEGAYAQYQQLAPAVPHDDRPMHCFIFDQREQWEEFTARRTGADAAMYLQIPRGGYTIDDWFVAYSDSDDALFRAAAHEGWHQYAARHFKGRLPPFLEEGLACLFEAVRMEDGLPRWNLSANAQRTAALSRAAREGRLWPLAQLVAMHSGEVVAEPKARIAAFYAQNWALARFMLEANDGRYRPMLRRWLADAADGAGPRWAPPDPRAQLEHYLQQDFASIERAYRGFVEQLTSGKEVRP